MIFLSPGNVEETETVQQIENAIGKTFLHIQNFSLNFFVHIFEQPPPGSGARRGDHHVQGQRAGIDSALCERIQDFDIFVNHLPCKSFVKFVNFWTKKIRMIVLISLIISKCEQRNLEFVNFIFSGKKKIPKMIDVSNCCQASVQSERHV